MREEEIPIIIIAKKSLGEYWMSIAIEAMKGNQEVMLHYTDKNAGQVELLLKTLKPFGWIEKDSTRGRTTSLNTSCLYRTWEGKCTNQNVKLGLHHCSEAIRKECANYERRDETPLRINFVIIEQVPSIRDL